MINFFFSANTKLLIEDCSYLPSKNSFKTVASFTIKNFPIVSVIFSKLNCLTLKFQQKKKKLNVLYVTNSYYF